MGLLVQLSITDEYSWDDIKEPLFEETLTRNVKWYVKDNPLLRFGFDDRNYGHWYRVHGPMEFHNEPNSWDQKPRRILKNGFLLHGIPDRYDPSTIRVDYPFRGYCK